MNNFSSFHRPHDALIPVSQAIENGATRVPFIFLHPTSHPSHSYQIHSMMDTRWKALPMSWTSLELRGGYCAPLGRRDDRLSIL